MIKLEIKEPVTLVALHKMLVINIDLLHKGSEILEQQFQANGYNKDLALSSLEEMLDIVSNELMHGEKD